MSVVILKDPEKTFLISDFTMQVFYGNIIHSTGPDSLQFLSPGCLVVQDGCILEIHSGDEAISAFERLKNVHKVMQLIKPIDL
jgi:hypothetical protein